MITNEFINAVLNGTVPGFDEADTAAIQWQYHRSTMGNFTGTLWDLIARADNRNLECLGAGYPTEVEGYRRWTKGDLAQRLRAAGEAFHEEEVSNMK